MLRVGLPLLASLVVLGPLGWMWFTSLVPDNFPVMRMGTPEFGTGSEFATEHGNGDHGARGRPVTGLVVNTDRPADVVVDLVADSSSLHIGSQSISGYTVNGTSPGPAIRATQGELVEVRFRNGSVPGGATLHWHGIDVPNAMDGVAGVTQDAVAPGESYTYRFVASRAGTYWYHSHQVSHRQVIGGLFGAVVIRPAKPSAQAEVVALAHTYAGVRTINGQTGDLRVDAEPGDRVRVRVINTDNATLAVWGDRAVRILAIDGAEVNDPGEVRNLMLGIGAGGRVDVEVTVPTSGAARIQLSKATSVIIGPPGGDPPLPAQPTDWVDFLSYGAPTDLGFDPTRPDRSYQYRLTRQPGFVKGKPGVWWAINGALYPHTPMFMVREGELVAVHFENATSETHPMHLHGHHALVLAKDGRKASGSPWWTDSLDILPGESYDLVFKADNPGIWMDHCHNLEHARDGMVAHLAYEGITSPFVLGGPHHNEPE